MPRALRQLDAIVSWWYAHRVESPDLARDEILTLLASLEQHPDRGMHGTLARTRMLIAPRTRLLVVYRVRPRARRVEVVEIRRP